MTRSMNWIQRTQARLHRLVARKLIPEAKLRSAISSAFLFALHKVLVAIVAVTILLPLTLHILGVVISSWITDADCNVGLFWTSCSDISDDDIRVSETEPTEFGWSVATLILSSTGFLCYSEIMLWFDCFDREPNIKTTDILLQTERSLFISGILNLSACSSMRSNCVIGCHFGVSYYLVNTAGWLMVIFSILPVTLAFICTKTEANNHLTLQRTS